MPAWSGEEGPAPAVHIDLMRAWRSLYLEYLKRYRDLESTQNHKGTIMLGTWCRVRVAKGATGSVAQFAESAKQAPGSGQNRILVALFRPKEYHEVTGPSDNNP